MERCDVELVLATDAPVCGGDLVEGFVAVTASKTSTCRSVTLALSWTTAGKGTVQSETVYAESVFAGELKAGERRLIPFAIPVPVGPFSYNGSVVSLAWTARADVEIAWARDAHAACAVHVIAPQMPRPAAFSVDLTANDTVDIKSLRLLFRIMGAFGALMGLALVAGGCAGTLALTGESSAEVPIFLPLGIALAGAFVAFISVAVAMGMNQRPLLAADSVLQAVSRAAPGETIDLTLRIRPTADLVLDDVTVTLLCEEIAVSTHGTQRYTARHEVFRHTVSLGQPGAVKAGDAVDLVGTLQIPNNGPNTLSIHRNNVGWSLEPTFSTPDMEQSFPRHWIAVFPHEVELGAV